MASKYLKIIARVATAIAISTGNSTFTTAQTFQCDGKLYYMVEASGSSVKLISVSNYASGSPVSTVECTLPAGTTNSFNALGANPRDGYMYFIEKKLNGNTQIRRLDANCNTTNVCPVNTVPFTNSGCFDHLGRFWIVDNDQLSCWNLNSCTRVKGPYNLPAGDAANDIIFNTRDCHFYSGKIKIDTTGNSTNLGGGSISGPGLAMGIDGKVYAIGGGDATSSVLTRYDLPSTSGTVVGNVSPGTVGGTDAASFPCFSVISDFTYVVSPGCAPPVSATFTDNSTGLVTSWLWDFGDGNTSTLQNPSHTYLSAGTYNVQLTVGATTSCLTIPTNSKTLSITIPAAISLSNFSKTDVLCFGGTNGSATFSVSGGTGAYTYSWSPSGGSNAAASSLGAGTYTLTVTDNVGCTAVTTAVVSEPADLTLTPLGSTLSCVGGNDGTVSITATGGTGAYTYLWSSGDTGTGVSNLTAGNYSVTVTDNNGCSRQATATITSPVPITVTPSSTNATCGGSNGSASISVSGGSSPYIYSWSPGGETTSSISNISGGSYTVTVTDNKSCTQATTIVVNNSGAATLTVDSTAVTCNGGANGTATVSVSGGTAPYSYSWNSSPAQTSATATGLSAGIYTIVVTDNAGCIASLPVTITEPAAVTIASSQADVSCSGGTNGSASITASGGSGIYSYAWSTGGTGTSVSSLSAGNYTVIVTDDQGCTGITSVAIIQPTALSLTPSSTNVSCFGGNNGTAGITASGGTSPYSYSWSPTGETTSNISTLSAGSYNVIVSDANGCTNSATATIAQPTTINLNTSRTDLSCNGNNIGSASVTASGGTGPYTYSWAPITGSSPTLLNLSPNTYTVTVADNNGCTQTTSVTITEPTAITFTTPLTATGASCYGGSNGTASVSVSGGTSPYAYTWLPSGGSGSTANNLPAGTYTVIITDNKGCTEAATAVVTQPTAISITTSGSNVSCFGGNDGTATVLSTSGGTGSYTYQWSPSGGTGTTLSNLIAGTYIVTVTDINGCTMTSSVTITESSLVNAAFAPDPTTGTAPLAVNMNNNSTGGLTHFWVFNDGTTDTTFNPSHIFTKVGDYTVMLLVTGPGGCMDSATYTIKVVEETVVCVPNIFTPNNDGTNEVFDLCGKGLVVIEGTIYNRWGQLLYTWDTPKGGWDGRTSAGEEVPDGTYYYIIYARGSDKKEYTLKGYVQLLRGY